MSVPVPAQRFYGRERVVATVLLDWAAETRQRLAAGGRPGEPHHRPDARYLP